jgi:hypothetical protein
MYAVGSPLSLLLGVRAIALDEGDPPTNVNLPVISGDSFLLTCSFGEWANDPTGYAFLWRRNGGLITGGADPTFQTWNIVAEDIGQSLTCTVTASNASGSTSATSVAVVPVASAPVNTVLPSISGGTVPDPVVGETLSAVLGTWNALPIPTFAVQWKNEGAPISGATLSTYTLQLSDQGDDISITVTATNVGGSASATSLEVGPIGASGDVTPPTLSGFSVEPDGEHAALLTVTTNEGNGTFYWVVQPDGLPAPSAAQIAAGLNGSGAAAVSSGSILVSSVDTFGGANPSGLISGTVYDAYGVQYDAVGNASVVHTDQFTTVGAPAPVLSAATALDFSDIFAWGEVTTNNSTGTLYAVVVASAAATPSAAQIVAGTDAAGAPAPKGSIAVTAIGARQVLVPGSVAPVMHLTPNTNYKICMVQQVPGPVNSNVVTATFKTDVFVNQFLHAGAALPTISFGVQTPSQPDYYGGNNAVLWNDNTDTLTGVVSCSTPNAVTFFNGENKFHLSMKYLDAAAGGGGVQWISFNTGNTGLAAGVAWINAVTRAVGFEQMTGPVRALDMGSGWTMFSGMSNMAHATDVSGLMSMARGLNNNSNNTVPRNGTNKIVIYNWRLTRV